MIPKIIHYCWFGKGEKNKIIKDCIASWKKNCPDFVIKEWNEENFDINQSNFTRKMYQEKRWAFVADYVRLVALIDEGGFYFDTDMLLVKPIIDLTKYECLLGEEEDGIISAGMIGAEKGHLFLRRVQEYYDTFTTNTETIPRILTKVYTDYEPKKSIKVLTKEAFYPFTSETIKNYHGQSLSGNTYGVHMWNYSWGHPLNKFFKKIRVYTFGKKVVEVLGVKKILKRLLGFI